MLTKGWRWKLWQLWCRLRRRPPTFSEMLTGGWSLYKLPGYARVHRLGQRLRGRCQECDQKLPAHKFGCSRRPGRGLRISVHAPPDWFSKH